MSHLVELEPLIESVANQFTGKGRPYGAERDDWLQELRMWVLANEDTVTGVLADREPKDADRYLARCLSNAAKNYLVNIKAQALGYDRDDLTWYTKNELKALLPLVFNEESWSEPPQSEGRTTKAPSEGGNWIATLADVAQAHKKLDLYDQSILEAFHKWDWTNKEMADREGVSEQMMSYYHDRAVGRLLEKLGGAEPRGGRSERDPWKGRHAVSNSTARSLASREYDDE